MTMPLEKLEEPRADLVHAVHLLFRLKPLRSRAAALHELVQNAWRDGKTQVAATRLKARPAPSSMRRRPASSRSIARRTRKTRSTACSRAAIMIENRPIAAKA
jgi:hypothetical protein